MSNNNNKRRPPSVKAKIDKANKRIAEKLKELNVNYKILVPTHKDWNEDLLCEGDEDLCQDFKL